MCSANRTAKPTILSMAIPPSGRKPRRAKPTTAFTSLGADAELDQVIFDGSSFGTAAPAGSDEEADYLGIPGLLDADQMRALLHRRQDEQLQEAGLIHGEGTQGCQLEYRGRQRCTASSAICAASSTPSSRQPTTAPANPTDGFTANFAVAAEARRSPPRPASRFRPASMPCGSSTRSSRSPVARAVTPSRRRAPRALRPRDRPTPPAGVARPRLARFDGAMRRAAPSHRTRRPPSTRTC